MLPLLVHPQRVPPPLLCWKGSCPLMVLTSDISVWAGPLLSACMAWCFQLPASLPYSPVRLQDA